MRSLRAAHADVSGMARGSGGAERARWTHAEARIVCVHAPSRLRYIFLRQSVASSHANRCFGNLMKCAFECARALVS